MKIFIDNVGLINKADIEVNGITVIGGYNNSGKSTILKAVYALLYSNFEMNEKILEERKRSLIKILEHNDILYALHYNSNGIRKLNDIIFEEYYMKEGFSQEEFSDFLKRGIGKTKESAIIIEDPDLFLNTTEPYEKQLSELYDKIETIFKRSDADYEKFIFTKYFHNIFVEKINTNNNKDSCKIEAEINKTKSFAEFNENTLVSYKRFPRYNLPILYFCTSHFTENRETIIYQELNNALKKEDGLDIIFESYNEIKESKETLKSILQEILHGNICISDGSLIYKDDNTSLSYNINNVASGMKNLLVIQKLLNNGSLGKNGILLIDEPETNLHPEWQTKFAEILVLLNKELNIKIVVNSHSPYFMRAIEVKLADYNMKANGHFYLMQEDGNGTFCTEDVTNNTNKIYEMLYKPLEYL